MHCTTWSLDGVCNVHYRKHQVVGALYSVISEECVRCALYSVNFEPYSMYCGRWRSVDCGVDQVHYFSVQCALNNIPYSVYN